MNRFAYIYCSKDAIGYVIPEIMVADSEPTENINDVLSLLINRYNVTEYEVI